VFGDDTRLLEPGEKEVRNPAITAAMRRIVLCEQAGTGMRMMQNEWQLMGRPAPVFTNDRSRKSFEFFIPGLDEELDAASSLMKAMFDDKKTNKISFSQAAQAAAQTEAQAEAQAEALVVSGDGTVDGDFLSDLEMRLLKALKNAPKTSRELLDITGYVSRTGNFKRCIENLLSSRLIVMTTPQKPRSPNQRYRLTEKAILLLNGGFKVS